MAPYTVITPEGEHIDCGNASTAKVIAERHPGSRIHDNDRNCFIEQHPAFSGLKIPHQQS